MTTSQTRAASPIRSIALTLALLAALPAPAIAQDAPPPPDNIGHTRHLHRHNQPHETVAPDGTRFTTSRTGAPLVLPTEQDSFFFVVFGDRTGGPVEGVSVLADAVRDTNLLEPDLVMTVGDLINGYNDADAWMAQMTEFKAIMNQLLCPWFPVVGNHDVYWRGEGTRPPEEHEGRYEMHFGPLWYAFEHKNCWFIALHSDEANPETGERNFNRPENHRMSDAQFQWLASVLERAKDAQHVFLFLHHPRWIGGQYGDQWDRVHELLVSAGNVRAVFAGHIHRMRYDARDGIEYVTLATVGGHQDGRVPETGWLHQFHVVTVRKDQIALAAIPVGEVMDVREITAAMADECARLKDTPPQFAGVLEMSESGAVRGEVRATVRNTASRPIDVTIMPETADSRWHFEPDHNHATIRAGDSREFVFSVDRPEASADMDLRPLQMLVQQEYLAEGFRYAIPDQVTDVPLQVMLPEPPVVAGAEHALRLDGRGWIAIDTRRASPPAGAGQPLTLECWMNADAFDPRTGLLAKTESSEYGIFVSNGIPEFSIHIAGQYLTVKAPLPISAGQWHHVAAVYDGREARLYVDGQQVAAAAREGRRTTSALPLIIGADVNAQGEAMSNFRGWIDAVRLSRVARYSGTSFTPERRPSPDDSDVLLLNFDPQHAIWTFDQSPARAHPSLAGTARVEAVPR